VSDAPSVVIAYVTAPPSEAERLADSIVTSRLAACVNVLPGVRSVYRWEGEVQRDDEALLLVKTSPALMDDLIAHVRGAHPYENPEVIAVRVLAGSEPYLRWVGESIRSD
jgi:periplasmic divalent cation tolerance protein